MKKFSLVGAAGYIAPRHFKAIKNNSCELLTAFDPNDSVGVLDSYFPNAKFFTEFEIYDRQLDELSRTENKIDYISICSPNYLHDSHIRYALRNNCDAICEKPLVLNPQELDSLVQLERETGRKLNTVLQLRLHNSINNIREEVLSDPSEKIYDVDLTYITSRGDWYLQSWKGAQEKSGGVAANIGVHFFDMLHYLFGKLKTNKLHLRNSTKSAGYLEYERARVRWFLSIDYNDLPLEVKESGGRTFRSISIDGKEIEFSGGFSDLHDRCYEEVLKGNGCGVEEARSSIEALAEIREMTISSESQCKHPFIEKR